MSSLTFPDYIESPSTTYDQQELLKTDYPPMETGSSLAFTEEHYQSVESTASRIVRLADFQEPSSLGELLDSWIAEGSEHDERYWAELRQLLKENPVRFDDADT